MYSPKAILEKSPSTIKGVLLAIGTALVVTGVIDISAEAAATWGLVIERVLELFVVNPQVVNKAALKEWDQAIKTEAVLNGGDLGGVNDAVVPEEDGVPALDER